MRTRAPLASLLLALATPLLFPNAAKAVSEGADTTAAISVSAFPAQRASVVSDPGGGQVLFAPFGPAAGDQLGNSVASAGDA